MPRIGYDTHRPSGVLGLTPYSVSQLKPGQCGWNADQAFGALVKVLRQRNVEVRDLAAAIVAATAQADRDPSPASPAPADRLPAAEAGAGADRGGSGGTKE